MDRLGSQALLTCPYCRFVFSIDPPEYEGGTADSEPPPELACLPSARDIGKFDGKGWSRLGHDFLPWLGWERIGILRTSANAQTVFYQSAQCPKCQQWFDVFHNPGPRALCELWPHLFAATEPARNDGTGGSANRPCLALRIVERLSPLFGYSGSCLVVVLCAYGVLHIPTILAGRLDLHSIVLGSASVLFVAVILQLMRRVISHVSSECRYAELFSSLDPRGLAYWRDFTLCRFSGIRCNRAPLKERGTSLLERASAFFRGASQVSLVGGGLSALALVISRVVVAASRAGAALWFPAAIGDLVWWVLVAYYMGVASWYLLDGAFYVFAGVRRLPLRMNPFDGLSALGPLEALAATMMRMALTEALFILLVIGSFTFLGAQGNEGVWLLWWAAIGTTVVGAAISQTVTRDTVAFRQRGALPITLIYVGAFVALSLHPVEVSLIPGLVAFSLRWLVSGAFLSLFLHYTTREVRHSLILFRERVKQEHLSAIESQIQELSDSLLVLRISDERQKRESCDLLTSENLLSALRSRHDLLEAVVTSGRRVATVIQSMGPLLISLAVPNLVELVRLVRSLFENPM